jgi:hypothetical protein
MNDQSYQEAMTWNKSAVKQVKWCLSNLTFSVEGRYTNCTYYIIGDIKVRMTGTVRRHNQE